MDFSEILIFVGHKFGPKKKKKLDSRFHGNDGKEILEDFIERV
jgi:hypothetical protein